MTARTKDVKPLPDSELPHPFKKALPGLGVKKDRLMVSLHIYKESIVLQNHETNGGGKAFKLVDAHDISNLIAGEMTFGSGLLPGDEASVNALWWSNTRNGPVTALWLPPGVRRLALQTKDAGPPERYDVPLPGLVFLCRPGDPPWVFAAARRPAGPKSQVFQAPLCNIYDNGDSCAGSQSYGNEVEKIPELFLRSFFTDEAMGYRSKKHGKDVPALWKELAGSKAKEYPLSDLVHHGTVKDLMEMTI